MKIFQPILDIRFPEQVLAIQLKKFLVEFSLFSTL